MRPFGNVIAVTPHRGIAPAYRGHEISTAHVLPRALGLQRVGLDRKIEWLNRWCRGSFVMAGFACTPSTPLAGAKAVLSRSKRSIEASDSTDPLD
jgi:hypothetical protein